MAIKRRHAKVTAIPLPFPQRELQSDVQTLLDASVSTERCTAGTQAAWSAIPNTSRSSAVGRAGSARITIHHKLVMGPIPGPMCSALTEPICKACLALAHRPEQTVDGGRAGAGSHHVFPLP